MAGHRIFPSAGKPATLPFATREAKALAPAAR